MGLTGFEQVYVKSKDGGRRYSIGHLLYKTRLWEGAPQILGPEGWINFPRVKYLGELDVVGITTVERHYIRMADNSRVLTDYGWMRAVDVNERHKIVIDDRLGQRGVPVKTVNRHKKQSRCYAISSKPYFAGEFTVRDH